MKKEMINIIGEAAVNIIAEVARDRVIKKEMEKKDKAKGKGGKAV